MLRGLQPQNEIEFSIGFRPSAKAFLTNRRYSLNVFQSAACLMVEKLFRYHFVCDSFKNIAKLNRTNIYSLVQHFQIEASIQHIFYANFHNPIMHSCKQKKT